ncbi:hypothetical protein ADU59_12395 [Pararhizobium polonicum]|uniref:Uncharacterized protein n=1 Tax=Pararhizobium polonicum TaxID=1612624 RepID=A0A1C7P2C1_9HYPH|nr:hypothetical protein ADU59_12395 [Pararhizobium polonicum]
MSLTGGLLILSRATPIAGVQPVYPDVIKQMPVSASDYLRERLPRQPLRLPSGNLAQNGRDG